MQVTATVDPHDVAQEMEEDGAFALDVLASLAEAPDQLFKELAENGINSEWHAPVPAFLRRLADHLEAGRWA